jgi:hypothetical protein
MMKLAPGLHSHSTDAAISSARSGDRLVGDGFGHVVLSFGDHVGDHLVSRSCPDRQR